MFDSCRSVCLNCESSLGAPFKPTLFVRILSDLCVYISLLGFTRFCFCLNPIDLKQCSFYSHDSRGRNRSSMFLLLLIISFSAYGYWTSISLIELSRSGFISSRTTNFLAPLLSNILAWNYLNVILPSLYDTYKSLSQILRSSSS